MIYVMSDLHGEYERYRKMLELIEFTDEDELFVLGDTADRGERPIDILLDMMERPNVCHLMGNHDLMALDILKTLSAEITEENYDTLSRADFKTEVREWLAMGGEPTLKQFIALSKEQRADVLDYISDFSFYEAVDVGDNSYIMTHAGLGDFRKDKKLSEYTARQLIMNRTDPNMEYYDDKSIYIISGHTPVYFFTCKNDIIKCGNNIMIDCGAAFDGRLGCLCLDTMEEFYV